MQRKNLFSMSDEDDYLKVEIQEPEPVLTYQKKRQRQLNKQDQTIKSKKIRVQEDLDERLQTEISSDNKGFKMLQKMGYKPGTGAKPIEIQIKSDKLGIGSCDPFERHKYESVAEKQEKKVVLEEKVKSFTLTMRSKFELQLLEKDLATARNVCMSLDLDHQVERHCFWPHEERPLNLLVDVAERPVHVRDMFEDETDIQLKFNMVNEYLRENYFYCIWCGYKFGSAKELKLECPGNTRKDHDD
jgi:hypothetical protein